MFLINQMQAYKMGQEFQKQVSSGSSKPKYEKVEEARSEDII